TVEHGHAGHRGFYGSWTQAGVPAGNLLAFGALNLARGLPEPAFYSWGWRVPFWFGIALTIIGFLIRRHIEESPLFEKQSQTNVVRENPLLTVIRTKWRNVLLVIGARFAENASFYVLTIFTLSYAEKRMDSELVVRAVMLGSALEFFTIPLYGILSDRIGRRGVYLFGTIGLVLFAFPFFKLFDSGSTFQLNAALIIFLGIFHAAMYAPQAAFFAEMFGTNMRFSGASLGYQLSSPIAGGLALNIAGIFWKWNNGAPWLVAGYLAAVGALSTVSVFLASETHKSDLTR
ncbi:MAG TPA: MFS transporter, partial [Planctomycetota bacterium]|nr:MFS transporter [Planctomycetota bacterium]